MICEKCKKDFPENLIERSHDIPKYIWGTDADGIHYLCVDCHDSYEAMILIRCYFAGFKEKILFWKDRRKNAYHMKRLKGWKSDIPKEIALSIKKEFYKEENNETDN